VEPSSSDRPGSTAADRPAGGGLSRSAIVAFRSTLTPVLEAPRIGGSFAAAVAAVPIVNVQWGALQFDPSVVTPLRPRAPSAFIYPRAFIGKTTCASRR
jgi:hypothetical protein